MMMMEEAMSSEADDLEKRSISAIPLENQPHNPLHSSLHPPLLPSSVASVVSSLSMASRVSIRFTALVIDSVFDSLKFSAAASLGVGRRGKIF
jgi:hypothetical protein